MKGKASKNCLCVEIIFALYSTKDEYQIIEKPKVERDGKE